MSERAWRGFKGKTWQKKIDVRDFMFRNYKEYKGDESFLEGPTDDTKRVYEEVKRLLKLEIQKGVLDADTNIISTLTSHEPGYIIKDEDGTTPEKIVGLQTDKPLKRAFHPNGGIRIAVKSAESHGFEVNPKLKEFYTKYRKTHNQGVFDVYTKEIRDCRSNSIITGLPDGYGRGRIIGDYRRVALYGIDRLIEERKKDKDRYDIPFTEESIRLREEIQEQLNSLNGLKEMAASYGFDISRPAENAREAIQWTYFGYLGAIKEQNGAAMSLGKTASFIDIYIERDMEEGNLTEVEAQELIDHFVTKLRLVRFARTPEYDELFTGDPTWTTESLAGMTKNGKKSWVTKSTFRYLHTLYNLGTAPEPNLTVLWSERLPENFKKYCAKVSIDTSSIQYENDDLMRPVHGDDYAIACCVSPMTVGSEMQFFGARANLAKALLYAINGGVDEVTGEQVGPKADKIELVNGCLDYNIVWKRYMKFLDWLAKVYVNTLNIIHYMHDKYAYEAEQMALLDVEPIRNFATGVAGLSVVADSLSAIKHARVKPIYDERGIVADFETIGEFPCYGINDDRVDKIAVKVVKEFMKRIAKNKTYRGSQATMSILTITSNVVYGKNTGATPDGRGKGIPFAPGANPMHGRDNQGALKSLASVAKIPCESCQDGISNTFTMIPQSLGRTIEAEDSINYHGDVEVENLVPILDGYFNRGGYHLNVNILNRETLIDAHHNPEKYPNLTIRVSGYAVNFVKLTDEQQKEVISRTFHERI